MRRLVTLTAIVALVGAFTFATAPAIAGGKSGGKKQGFGRLDVPIALPLDGWLIHHYDNRTGQVTGGPDFDDSAEVIFEGTIIGIGLATVEQSAAWTFNSYALDGGPLPHPPHNHAGPCALAYTSDNPRTLVRIHTHAGVSTENESGAPLTLIPGAEFPFSDTGFGADVLFVDTTTFTGTVKITDGDGDEINGDIKGGTNCEVEIFDEPLHDAPPWNFDHSDTRNTVTTVFEIVTGTGKFAEISGDGVLVFTYDTDEPHTLLHAHIALNLE